MAVIRKVMTGRMGKILLTGGSGIVGSALTKRLLAQGHTVYSLSRHPVKSKDNLIGLSGDILKPYLGMSAVPARNFDACYHLAAVMRLGRDKNGSIWRTNVEGTKNVLDLCLQYNIPHLYYCSTAYTQGRNVYERTKRICEILVEDSDIPRKTIFRPSIIMPSQGQLSDQQFLQYVMLLIKVHRRAEVIRRKIEGTLRLPILTPVFRIKGDPDSVVNLVTVDAVADAMANIGDEGTYWLTNPQPPKLKDICEWVGDFIMVRLEAHWDFTPTPLELAFEKMTSAFSPYLEGGDTFPSDIPTCPITREYTQQAIKKLLGY
ncbi:MAG: SDR family oxidoreductase [Dehalococcoidia bacterium]|nr:SDR family oxidoreductase [Dehalococcoidia bacterium]